MRNGREMTKTQAKAKLRELRDTFNRHRNALIRCRNGDETLDFEACKRAVEMDIDLIYGFCKEYNLPIPIGVPENDE